MNLTVRFGLLAVAVVALAVGLTVRSGPARMGRFAAPKADAPVQQARVRIVSTMLAERGLGEWGFAAVVEANGHRLLFDTGAHRDVVSRNAGDLGIDLTGIDDVVLSHNHADHTGGLVALRREVEASPRALAVAHVARGIFWSRPGRRGEQNGMIAAKARYEELGGRFVESDGPVELWPGVWLTGPVPRPFPERNWGGHGKVMSDHGLVEDDLPEDQSLVLDTPRGLVVVSGCGHAGIVNTLTYARKVVRDAPVIAVIGGFHLFEADEATLAFTAEHLREMGVANFLGAHCTGIEAVHRLRDLLGLSRASCVVGAVGASFTLGEGIDPLRLAR